MTLPPEQSDVRQAAVSAALVAPAGLPATQPPPFGRLYVGGYLAAADRKAVRDMGVSHIVKLFADDPSYPGGAHRHPGVQYLVCPTEDRPAYDIRSDVVRALPFIRDGLARGKGVLVHCHAGISRSVTVVLFYLMVHERFTLDAALRLVRGVRPYAEPNVGFMRCLRATDTRLGRLLNSPGPGHRGP